MYILLQDWQPSHQMAASSALGPQNGITISLSKSDPAHSNQTILTVLRECTEIRAHIELSEGCDVTVTTKK